MTAQKSKSHKAIPPKPKKDDSILHFAFALREFLGVTDRDGPDCCTLWAEEQAFSAEQARRQAKIMKNVDPESD